MKKTILSLLAFIMCITLQAQPTKPNKTETIVTNRQYREFTYWVRDSIVNYLFEHGYSTKIPLNPQRNKYGLTSDPAYRQCLGYFAIPIDERLNAGDVALNEKRIFYAYKINNRVMNIPIYPDTLCWARSSGLSNDADPIRTYPGNVYDALTSVYFSNKWFDDYPVVGINQEQADAYMHWKNRKKSRWKNAVQLIDATEQISLEKINTTFWQISAADYKVFTQWITDSVLIQKINTKYTDFAIWDDKDGNPLEYSVINWSQRKVLYSKDFANDPEVKIALSDYYQVGDTTWNVSKTTCSFRDYNLAEAAKIENHYDYKSKRYLGKVVTSNNDSVPIRNRASFIHAQSVPVFPGVETSPARQKADSAVWINLTTFTPDINKITYQQAIAYWHWFATVGHQKSRKVNPLSLYLRPSKAGWEALRTKGAFPTVAASIALPTKIVSIQRMD